MLVKVAIDLALDRLFTYAVPVELEKELAVGQLLSVPFGWRTARGYAFSVLTGEAAREEGRGLKLKTILGIVDKSPFFSTALLQLVQDIAVYTVSPLESVLKAAIPAAVVKPNARPRERIYVDPVPDKDPAALTARQQWLYAQLLRLDGGWLGPLCTELKTTAASLRNLSAAGFATIAPRHQRRDPLRCGRILPSHALALNAGQAAALHTILSDDPRPVLLHGITGSGKTEVYLQAIAAELERGRGAIVMVPEISLTPQTVQRFVSRFGNQIAVLHSALSDGERYDEWHRIRSGEARVAVGPRSAVFAPVRNLGLIVVDEEHETSYKQEEQPRYHARDVAVLRGRLEGTRVVLGSATPSLESWMNVQKGKYVLAAMSQRAGNASLPHVQIVDMNAPQDRGKIFSQTLLQAIQSRLDNGEQTILFLNRRGYSRSVTCENCGHTLACEACDLPYTYHRADNCLRCHICGRWMPVPSVCPQCHSKALSYKGIGTQRAEVALQACFKRARILRMDADSTSRKHSHDDILGAFRRHEADILVGTQMIAKGLDFPNVTLVGVLNADSSLNMPDFRAAERTFQLLAQVSGRAGRSELPGTAVIQTYAPDEPAIVFAARGDYAAFARQELAARKEGFFPPYCHLASVNLRSKNAALVSAWADMYAKSLAPAPGLTTGEAAPSALEKADGWYRWQIVLRAEKPGTIIQAWRWLAKERPAPKELKVALDMDARTLI